MSHGSTAISMAATDPNAAGLENTLAIIKPDAAGAASEIIQLAELAGFTVIAANRLQAS